VQTETNAGPHPIGIRRRAVLAAISVVIGPGALLLVADVVLRFFPVNSGLGTLPVNDVNPVMRFAPNREFTYSDGWNFAIVNHGRTNNYGFVNNQDYDSTARTPLLSVVGDSYVEALMVHYEETLQGRLARLVGRRGRVYSFGMSGSALSQYLAEVDFARARFRPSGLVVVIVANDFDESLLRYKAGPGLHYFREDSAGLRLARMDYAPSLLRRAARHSAIASYLIRNLGLSGLSAGLRARLKNPAERPLEFVGNTVAAADSQRMADSRRVVDAFLDELPSRSGLDPSRVALLVDGMRPNLYSEAGLKASAGSYFDLMRRYLLATAASRGFEVVDMQPRFIERHQRDGSRFEFPTNGHWNAIGHEEAADAVAKSPVFQKTFGLLDPSTRRRGN